MHALDYIGQHKRMMFFDRAITMRDAVLGNVCINTLFVQRYSATLMIKPTVKSAPYFVVTEKSVLPAQCRVDDHNVDRVVTPLSDGTRMDMFALAPDITRAQTQRATTPISQATTCVSMSTLVIR